MLENGRDVSGRLPGGKQVTYQLLGSTRATALEWLGVRVGLGEGGHGGRVGLSVGKNVGWAGRVSWAEDFYDGIENRMTD